jgi:putative phosphonate metabolism protein
MTTPRYALYYAPAPGSDLDRFGSALLGYDAHTGDELAYPQTILQGAPDWADLTQDPRKYGFHATLKAPFSLPPGMTEPQLLTACEAFTRQPRPIPIIKPVIASVGGFIAIAPMQPSDELEKLAADCVSAFDSFRAQLTPEDRARRKPELLTPRQREHLDRWGYPYVMNDFRFHMTLTGKLSAARHEMILTMLRPHFAALNISTLAIDRLAVFRQDDAGSRFRIVRHYALQGSC